MGHTNSSVNYNLPQFVGTDKPSWLGDVNGAFLAIDTAIAAAKAQADYAAGGVDGLQTVVGGHTTQIGTLTDTVTAQGGTLNSVTSLIGNGTPTTTDQTIIGAINELAAIVEPDSVEVTADGTKTYGVLLGELQAAITNSKLSHRSVLTLTAANGSVNPLRITTYGSSTAAFDYTTDGGSGKVGNFHILLSSGNNKYSYQDGSAETVLTNNAAPSGMKIKLIY